MLVWGCQGRANTYTTSRTNCMSSSFDFSFLESILLYQLALGISHEQIKGEHHITRLTNLIYVAPAMLISGISGISCSSLWSRWACAYFSLVLASRYCWTWAILEYVSAQTGEQGGQLFASGEPSGVEGLHLSWIFTGAWNEGSR